METEIFEVRTQDGVEGLSSLEDNSVKLLYGSPPYPNAKRNYGIEIKNAPLIPDDYGW